MRSRQPASHEKPTRRLKRPLAAPTMPIELLDAAMTPEPITMPARVVIAIDGEGSPASPAFKAAVGALYGVAYTLKLARVKSGRESFSIGPLEGRWSAAADAAASRHVPPPEQWRWRLRLAIPADVDALELELAKATVLARKGGKLAGSHIVPHVFTEVVLEQRVGRILHVGPYATEPASLARLDAMLTSAGETPARSHVEIYLSDPQRTPAARLRTVLLRELATN